MSVSARLAKPAVLTSTGSLLNRLMRLGDMPDADRREWIDAYAGAFRATTSGRSPIGRLQSNDGLD
jgi:hypothetical protein